MRTRIVLSAFFAALAGAGVSVSPGAVVINDAVTSYGIINNADGGAGQSTYLGGDAALAFSLTGPFAQAIDFGTNQSTPITTSYTAQGATFVPEQNVNGLSDNGTQTSNRSFNLGASSADTNLASILTPNSYGATVTITVPTTPGVTYIAQVITAEPYYTGSGSRVFGIDFGNTGTPQITGIDDIAITGQTYPSGTGNGAGTGTSAVYIDHQFAATGTSYTINFPASTNNAAIQGLTLQATPEPGAIGLFALVGIPALARRRRRRA